MSSLAFVQSPFALRRLSHQPCLSSRQTQTKSWSRPPPRAEMVHVSVPLKIEAPPDHCYQLFSDLSEMSSWSSTLRSVKRDEQDPMLSTWRFSWNGINLSWRARDADPIPGEHNVVRWSSISGLLHTGCVQFEPSDSATNVVFTVDYDIAALLAVVLQSAIVSSFVESAIRSDLNRFRAFALRKYRAQRIRSPPSSV